MEQCQQHHAGDCVELHGLAGAAHLNGHRGVLVDFSGPEQRWVVHLFSDGKRVKVRAGNLRAAPRRPGGGAAAPLPDGLRRLPDRFAAADPRGVAPDVAPGVRALVRCAWDGTMLPGQTVPLREAVRDGTAELDAAALDFMSNTQREMDAMLGPGVFDHGMLARDVVGAFGLVKSLSFDMRLIDFDNIQAALSMKLDTLGAGPARDRLFVIQAFCQRVVEYNNSLKQRVGTSLPDPAVPADGAAAASNNGGSDVPRQECNYEISDRIVGGPFWPRCVSGSYDWARMFGRKDGDDDDGPWLTPRMAARIHYVAVRDAALEDFAELPPRLPKIARPFFKKSKSWRLAFGDCYARIAMRLQRGLPPSPNCTAEELAFHNIMYVRGFHRLCVTHCLTPLLH